MADWEGLKWDLTKKLECMIDMDMDDDILAKFINTKSQLNLQIKKDGAF